MTQISVYSSSRRLRARIDRLQSATNAAPAPDLTMATALVPTWTGYPAFTNNIPITWDVPEGNGTQNVLQVQSNPLNSAVLQVLHVNPTVKPVSASATAYFDTFYHGIQLSAFPSLSPEGSCVFVEASVSPIISKMTSVGANWDLDFLAALNYSVGPVAGAPNNWQILYQPTTGTAGSGGNTMTGFDRIMMTSNIPGRFVVVNHVAGLPSFPSAIATFRITDSAGVTQAPDDGEVVTMFSADSYKPIHLGYLSNKNYEMLLHLRLNVEGRFNPS